MKFITISIILLVFATTLQAQEVYVHVSNTGIYEFLDEMANEKLIEINSLAKPYSRVFIAQKLDELSSKRPQLNKRQEGELDFYLKDFNKEIKPNRDFKKRLDLFYHKDSLFTLSVNPILGETYYRNGNGTAYHRWNGAEIFSYMGPHFAFYANLRDNHESKVLTGKTYLTEQTGSNYKFSGTGGDYSEVRGGLTYSWKWGSVGMVKDHIVWGEGYHGTNILSGHQPSFALLKLNLKPTKWFEFNYIHGWLVSEIVDSSKTYISAGTPRYVYHDKYIAANFFTFKFTRFSSFSVGNSIVYSDIGVQPVYLIPFLFYKSADHTYNGVRNDTGQNSQMFGSISIRDITHLHLYSSLFIDEISIDRMFKSTQSNYLSIKAGIKVDNLIKNTGFIAEYTRSNPMVYKHFVSTTTFESNKYNMGHYLKDNARELYLSTYFKFVKNLKFQLSYTKAEKGTDYTYSALSTVTTTGLPFMDKVIWENKELSALVQYQFLNDIYLSAQIQNNHYSGATDVYTPPYLVSNGNTYSLGLNWGF
jgi:hypothetical protein